MEYIGSVGAEDRAPLIETLNAEISRLVAANVATEVVSLPPAEVAAACGGECDISHLPPDQPVRVVSVGDRVGCPCGGTHVGSTSELGALTVTKVRVKKGRTKVSYRVDGA